MKDNIMINFAEISKFLKNTQEYDSIISKIQKDNPHLKGVDVKIDELGTLGNLLYKWEVLEDRGMILFINPVSIIKPQLFEVVINNAFDKRDARKESIAMALDIIEGLRTCKDIKTENESVDGIVYWRNSAYPHHTNFETLSNYLNNAFGLRVEDLVFLQYTNYGRICNGFRMNEERELKVTDELKSKPSDPLLNEIYQRNKAAHQTMIYLWTHPDVAYKSILNRLSDTAIQNMLSQAMNSNKKINPVNHNLEYIAELIEEHQKLYILNRTCSEIIFDKSGQLIELQSRKDTSIAKEYKELLFGILIKKRFFRKLLFSKRDTLFEEIKNKVKKELPEYIDKKQLGEHLEKLSSLTLESLFEVKSNITYESAKDKIINNLNLQFVLPEELISMQELFEIGLDDLSINLDIRLLDDGSGKPARELSSMILPILIVRLLLHHIARRINIKQFYIDMRQNRLLSEQITGHSSPSRDKLIQHLGIINY